MKIFTEFKQGEPAWFEFRRGRITASNMDRIMTAKQCKLSAASREYLCELIGEKATPELSLVPQGYVSPAALNGSLLEPEARAFYEMTHNVSVLEVGACLSDCERFSCSPDGLVGDEGGIELKCVQPKTQVKYLLDEGQSLLDDYKIQVAGCLIVTGRKWWDLMSYCRGLDPVVLRVVPDEFSAKLLAVLNEFWKSYQEAEAKIYKRRIAA